MIAKAFRSDPVPWTIFYFVVLCLLVSRAFILPFECPEANASGLIAWLINSSTLNISITVLGIILAPFWFRNIIIKAGILDFRERVSLFPLSLFLVTVILTCGSLIWVIAGLLILGLLSILFQLKEDDSLSSASFKAGLIISICSFISPWFFLLLLFVWPSLSILRALNWRAVIWTIIGLVTPWYLGFSIHYIISGELDFYLSVQSLSATTAVSSGTAADWRSLVYITFCISATILMLIYSLSSARKGTVRRRSILRIGGLLLIVTLILSGVLYQFESATPYLSLMAVPLAIFYLEMMKEDHIRLHSILFILWLIVSFFYVWK